MLERAPLDFQVDIMGGEIEWAITAQKKDGTACTEEEYYKRNLAKMLLSKCLPPDLVPQNLVFLSEENKFLLSGDRIYVDSGRHVETSTGEGRGPLSMVIYAKRCEQLMEEVVKRANQILEEEGIYLRSFKNNVDTEGITYGAHENYFIPGIKDVTYNPILLSDNLIPFLVTSQLFLGNGKVVFSQEGKQLRASYHISQRASYIVKVMSVATTQNRALINTRHEPHVVSDCGCGTKDCFHVNSKNYMRLHLIFRDSLMNQAAIFLKFGTTAIVLEMIIHEFLGKAPFGELSDQEYLRAFHNFSRDPSLRTVCRLGGKSYSMLRVQKFYLKRAFQFYRKRPDLLTPEKLKVLSLWRKVLRSAGAKNPAEALGPYVDWAVKKCLIERDMKRHGYSWDSDLQTKEIVIQLKDRTYQEKASDHLSVIDLRFHENSPRGYARMLEAQGFSMRLVKDEEIAKYRRVPIPETTRICARSGLLHGADEYTKRLGIKLKISIDWTYIILKDESEYQVASFLTLDPRDFRFEWKDPRMPISVEQITPLIQPTSEV